MKKLIIVKSIGRLPIYGGISGPITTPTLMKETDIVSLINNRKDVYEVNPYNNEETIKLTRINYNKINFEEPVVILNPDESDEFEEIIPEISKQNVKTELPKDSEMGESKKETPTMDSNLFDTKLSTINPINPNQTKKTDMKKIDSDFVSNSKHKKN